MGDEAQQPVRSEELARQFVRSDEQYDYFRVSRQMTVRLTKPLGAVLEEEASSGVKVEDILDGGCAAQTGLLKKGDRLTSVMDADVSNANFDEVMELLVGAPDEVELGLVRNVIVRKLRKDEGPILLTADGKTVEVDKGVIMRTALQQNGITVHKGMKAKLNSCGGGGQCSSCWVEVLEGMDNLSKPTEVEEKRAKKKPPNYRMSCQSLINGAVKVVVKSLD